MPRNTPTHYAVSNPEAHNHNHFHPDIFQGSGASKGMAANIVT